jgi:hypothetical protein
MRREFTRTFFLGFTDPDGSLTGDDVAAEHGFEAGQEFRRHCNPAEVKQAMEDYGYVATEAAGTWVLRDEVNCFRPRNIRGQNWWLTDFGGTFRDFYEVTGQPVSCHISGFLSPKGQYGHGGTYDHKFYVAEIIYTKKGR